MNPENHSHWHFGVLSVMAVEVYGPQQCPGESIARGQDNIQAAEGCYCQLSDHQKEIVPWALVSSISFLQL